MPTFINRIYFGLHDNIGVPPFLFPFNFSSFSFLFSSFFLSFLVLFLSSIFLSFFLLFSCSPFLFFPFFPPQFCPQDPNFADRSDYWGGVTPPHTPPLGTPLIVMYVKIYIWAKWDLGTPGEKHSFCKFTQILSQIGWILLTGQPAMKYRSLFIWP